MKRSHVSEQNRDLTNSGDSVQSVSANSLNNGLSRILTNFSLQKDSVLLGLSFCREMELNSFKGEVREFWGNYYDLSSLGGVPVYGQQSIDEFVGHSKSYGCALLLYGVHICSEANECLRNGRYCLVIERHCTEDSSQKRLSPRGMESF